MKVGGGKPKGSAFERKTGLALSLWISGGARIDLFSRNVLSGGRFTNASKKDGSTLGIPGDLMAAHPLAFEFLSIFNVECKSYKDIKLDSMIYDWNKSFLGQVFNFTKKQSLLVGLRPIVIAKSDYREPIVLVDREVGIAAWKVAYPQQAFRYHCLHQHQYYLFPFSDLTSFVKPNSLLKELR